MTTVTERRDQVSARFQPTEHLASEAIAAFTDGELRLNPYLRAAAHLAVCPECAAEVEAQRQASGALRDSGEIAIPGSLLGALSQIPQTGLTQQASTPMPAARRWALPWNAGWRRK